MKELHEYPMIGKILTVIIGLIIAYYLYRLSLGLGTHLSGIAG